MKVRKGTSLIPGFDFDSYRYGSNLNHQRPQMVVILVIYEESLLGTDLFEPLPERGKLTGCAHPFNCLEIPCLGALVLISGRIITVQPNKWVGAT